MLKHIYRIIILIAVFVAALYYFSRDIKEVVFDIDNTTTMEEATFPLVTIKSGENKINMLHGYSTNMDANKVREAVTPIGPNQAYEVQFNKEALDIKKLNYEIREFVGNSLIEADSVSVFEENGDIQSAKVKINTELETEKEYAVKITLITSKTEKIYFYHRIKKYEKTYLKESIDFINDFHKAIMDKASAGDIIQYIEPSGDADNSTLSYVNIHSSFDLICWGDLKPKIVSDIVPTVKEIYEDIASVELSYFMQATVAGVTESYRVTEFYRVRYATDRMKLLNYERYMESLFDIKLANISENKLKLGITSEHDIQYRAGADSSKIAFVRNRELWFYDLENNKITKVFSFRQEKTDYIRDLYDQHNIRILNMDAEGNINFLVYGYMNRGQYEGRVAVILYRYIRAEDRVQELVYIPVNEPYQSLKENLGELSYLNAKDVFYFHLYNTIYAYNLITRELTVVASDIEKQQIVVLKNLNYVVWQESNAPNKSKNIDIMNLETGVTDKIGAAVGYNVRLMGIADDNIVYGFVKEGDITAMVDGSIIVPLETIEIASVDKKISTSYKVPGYYVTGLTVKDNIIEMRRVQKVSGDGEMNFVAATNDRLINQKKAISSVINITSESGKALTEYYMSLPSEYKLKELPKVLTTKNTVISEDPTVRLYEKEMQQLSYYPYIAGGIEGMYENAADAIAVVREGIGVVVDSSNQLIWERGAKPPAYTISQFENMNYLPSSGNTIVSCIRLVLAYQGVTVSEDQLSTADSSAYNVMKKYSKYTPVRLTGITPEDAFYYIAKGRPVIAMTDANHAIIIYGYDSFNIMVLDPSKGKVSKMGIQDSADIFTAAGNVFLSYLEK